MPVAACGFIAAHHYWDMANRNHVRLNSVGNWVSTQCLLEVRDTLGDLVLFMQSFRGRRLLDGVQELHKAGTRNNHRASAHQWGGHSCHR